MLNGLMRGLQLVADFFHLLNWAITQRNWEAISDCQTLTQTWLSEARDTGLQIGISPWTVLTSDPFQGSRALLEKLRGKYGRL